MRISDMGIENVETVFSSRDKTFKKVLVNTFLEYNMVLDNWRINSKKTAYGDYISLVKTLITKHLKENFNPATIGNDLRRCDFGYEISHGRLSKVLVYYSPKLYSVVDAFVQYVKDTDFEAFTKEIYVLDEYRKSQEPQAEITDINDINFKQILNIKF